jgi:hypothetical protein
MTSAASAASAAPVAVTAAEEQLCCRKPLSTIAVTTRGANLTLHSCTSCGRHVWVKDGVVADRDDLLDGVKSFLEQPREIVRRRSPRRSAAAASR